MHWQNLIHVVAFTNGIFLTISLALASKFENRRAHISLVLFMAGLATLLAIFTFVDAGWLPVSRELQGFHDLVALLIPAFFLQYVDSVSDHQHNSVVFYLPGIAYLTALIVHPQWTLNSVRLEHIIGLQICCSAYASAVLYRHFHGERHWPRHLATLLTYLWLLHLTQLLRMFLPESGWVFDTVPLVGSVFFIALTLMVINDKQIFDKLLTISKSRLVQNAGLFRQLQELMVSQRPWLDPTLNLKSLAVLADMSERNLSGLLNAENTNFFQFVNHYRIEEAKRLLSSENEKRTSIEAIALLVGFRSRSAFYESFRKEQGCTPASYRKQIETDSQKLP